MTSLSLQRLADKHVGLTFAVAECYSEAASVCLSRHHKPPTLFEIQDEGKSISTDVDWVYPALRVQEAFANETDTTEWGAYAFALAGIELSRGLIAVRRAETRSGADYYLAPAGTEVDFLEDCIRLEVSGMDRGTESDLDRRIRQKLAQAERGASNLPAVATVVVFREQKMQTRDLRE